jgi:hypothetical protein
METNTPVAFHRYCATGVLHVHTTRSDGSGEPEDIARAGIEAGLDYIAYNDHRNLRLMDEGWHGRKTESLLSIVGSELQHRDRKNHLLVYGVTRLPDPRGHILDQLSAVRESGGIAVIAHPREKRPLIPGLGEYPWRFGTQHSVSGVEAWNWMSSWKRRVNPMDVWGRIRDPDRKVRHPHSGAVDMWFETGGCLVGGADAHGHRILGRNVFTYRMLFDRVRTHILLNEPFTSPDQFTEALRSGSCFMSNHIEGDASDFRSAVFDGQLFLRLPGQCLVAVREKGRPFRPPVPLPAGTHCLGPLEHPLYIEVYRNGRTWIAQGRR